MITERVRTANVLVVEDDWPIRHLLKVSLSAHDYEVSEAETCKEAISSLARQVPDLLLLDLGLPDGSGIELLRRLRQEHATPVIVLSVQGAERTKIEALDLGADDYLTKPFSARELWARIQAVLRRTIGPIGAVDVQVRIGPLVIDAGRRRVELDGRELVLTTYEFALLHALALRAGRVMSRENLIDLVRGSSDEAFERSVDVHISRLRQKLGDDPRQPRWLKTVRGAGYVLASEDTVTS